MTEQLDGQKVCSFNPKKKPNEKIGTCQHEEHYDITDTPKRGQKVRLWMLYSDKYNDFIESDKSNLSEDEIDKLYDDSENWQYLPNSEKYYCEDCFEASIE